MADYSKNKKFYPADPSKRFTPQSPMAQPMPKVESEQSPFSPMLQGTGSNKLSQISTRSSSANIDAITGVATISSGDFKVFIEGYRNLAAGLRISSHKLLDACAIALTRQNDFRGEGELLTTVIIPLDEYVKMLGKPETKSTMDEVRKRVKEDLETLYSVSIEWREKSGKNVKDYAKMRIVSSHGIKRGNIHVGFSPEFAKYLTGSYIMQYPTALLKIDERNPSTYHLGRKLLLHFSMDNNRKKGTSNMIGVRALLSVCPDIPSYEEVMQSGRHTDRRIKSPFEEALNALEFIVWEYANQKGAPLSDAQLAELSFEDFANLYIRFTVKNFRDGVKENGEEADGEEDDKGALPP